MSVKSKGLSAFINSLSTNIDELKALNNIKYELFYEPTKPIRPTPRNQTIPVTRSYYECPPVPSSRISNKARIYPSGFGNQLDTENSSKLNIFPQNINDSLKPPGSRFKYFEKPTIPVNRGDYTDIINEFIIHDNEYADRVYDHATLQEFKHKFETKGISLVPPEVYTYNWHTFNKQFIVNRCKNAGTYISGPSTIIDPYILHTLKQLYPNVNEKILRQDYNNLVIKHNLVDCKGFSIDKGDVSLIQILINDNPLIARLASIITHATTIDSLYDSINHATEMVPDQFITSKFPCINKHIIDRDKTICKLAFICGSTNETIICDIELIRKFIKLVIAQL
jgi:hypothetical protein